MVGVLQSEALKIAKLVQITPITTVYGTCNELVIGAYKPTNITGGPHFVHIATNFWRNPSLLGDNIHFNISLVDIKLISLFCLVKHVKTPWFFVHKRISFRRVSLWIFPHLLLHSQVDGSYFEVVKTGSLIWIGLLIGETMLHWSSLSLVTKNHRLVIPLFLQTPKKPISAAFALRPKKTISRGAGCQ